MKYFYQNEAGGDDLSGGAAPEADQTPETIISGDPAPAETIVTEPDAATPEEVAEVDWRTQIAGTDEKLMKQLERFTDVSKFAESYTNAQDKIRAGETSNGLPDNPTDEQLAAYREANNVPTTAEDYALALDEGLVLGDIDERIMKGVYDAAHQNNISNEAMSQVTNAMLKGREIESQAQVTQDNLDRHQSTAMLKDNWGQDYETNVGLVQGIMQSLPEAIRDDFASARMADGTAVFNSPEMMNFFADAARAINPAATVVPAGTGNPMQAVTSRIAELEGRMGEPGWHKDTAANKELMDLYTAREGLTK
ncbi:hypothetical protein OAO65_02295 [Flavobacteriales bacterium]|nr:hypothetical protein [Flavobacteriales bacterium]